LSRLYLDHAATTPVLPEAVEAMTRAYAIWANPSSPHAEGRAARAELEAARKTIADVLGWRHDVILTSGASESIAIVAKSAKPVRRLVGATEHDVVPAAMGEGATVLPVDRDGLIDITALCAALEGEPALVAIQQVNNETGVIQPITEIAERVRAAGSLILADCAQSAGKLDLPDADFIAVAAHKFGGPPGVGALLVRDVGTLRASGGQEKGYRRGTQAVPAVAGMAAALGSRVFADAMPRLKELRAKLEKELGQASGAVIAADAPRSAAIGAIAMPGVTSASQLVQFDLAGIAISAGSACSSGSMKASRVLAAMGINPALAECVIRVSFGPTTNEADIDRFVAEWRRIASRAGLQAA
jgi:cysteine desulfurase